MEFEKVVEILWTGGYDSTFRVVQLSHYPIKIKPYYLSDNRKSESYELNAIEKITELLKRKDDTKCQFLPLTIVSMSERIDGEHITQSYNKLLEKEFFGSQYDWLGRFAQEHKGIELSIHKDDKAMNIISQFGGGGAMGAEMPAPYC